MKVAIVGFGAAGQARLVAYRGIPGVTVAAVVEPVRRSAVAVAAGCPVFHSLTDLIEQMRVDAVDICAPPAVHVALAEEALRGGLHVICEKPVATSAAEAIALAELSTRNGRLLYPAHNYGFSPMMRVLTDTMSSGVLGAPVRSTFRILRPTHAKGVATWRPDWRRDPAIARGGILLDHGTHCVYMATRLFGAAPDTVSCVAGADDGEVEETANLLLTFPQGSCDIELSWISDVRTNEYVLRGPHGCLEIRDGLATLNTPERKATWNLVSPTDSSTHEEWFAAMFADFTGRIADNAFTEPLAECVTTAGIVELAYRSARLAGETLPMSIDLPVVATT
jgi:predicted dehydrogenase